MYNQKEDLLKQVFFSELVEKPSGAGAPKAPLCKGSWLAVRQD